MRTLSERKYVLQDRDRDFVRKVESIGLETGKTPFQDGRFMRK
jgi:hypothetical protein